MPETAGPPDPDATQPAGPGGGEFDELGDDTPSTGDSGVELGDETTESSRRP